MNQEEFGKIIKKIRKDNNLTQQQLANKYNVTYQAVSKWENGKNMPDTVIIKQIAEEILSGNINIYPYYKKKKTPCEYCSYKNVCGFNSGLYKTEYNFINKKQKEDIFEKLEKEN